MSSSAVNNCRYGDIFPFVRSELDREIQGLSFIVWCAVKLLIYQVWEAVTTTALYGNTSAMTYHLSRNL